MNERNIHIGEVLVAIGSYTASMNQTHKHNITKGKSYTIVRLYDTVFSVIDNFNDEMRFTYNSLDEQSVFYVFSKLNEERVKKIKSLEL